jgi:tetratricopeptide (TPR) repeat protein
MKKNILILIVAVVIIAAAFGGYYFWQKDTNNAEHDINPMDLLVFEIKIDSLTDYQKERAFTRFNNAKNIINQNNSEENEEVRNNINFFPWLEVAGAQKIIGDYERSAQVLIWFTDVHSGNSVSPANLGNLYKSFLVDNEKSEKYYKIALERDPDDWQIYFGFFDLYRYNFDDPDKAIAVMQDGAKNNPDEKNYVVTLANYLIELERIQEAEVIINDFVARHPEAGSLRDKLK